MSIEESGVRLRSAGANTDGTVDEVRDLKACVNDLVGILTLPAMWSRSEPNQIVTMLLDVVLRILRLDFVYARLRLGAGAPKETFRFADSCRSSTNEDVLRRALGQWLTHDSDTRTSVLPWPGEDTRFSVAAFRLGTTNQIGEFVAGNRRPGFPSKTERLVLNIAANQAAIGLEEARLRTEQRRIAKGLDLAEARPAHAAQVAAEAERAKQSLLSIPAATNGRTLRSRGGVIMANATTRVLATG